MPSQLGERSPTYLNRARATVARADRVVFCSGSAQGIGLLCRVLRERGVRRIAVEDPGHTDQCTDIRKSGLETPRILPSMRKAATSSGFVDSTLMRCW